MDAKNAALGERIRRARKTLGLTQQEFADQLEVTQPTVHRWEKGFYDPDEEALRRLSGMTKLTPAYFRYGDPGTSDDTVSVNLVGYVGAAAEIRPLDGHGNGHDSVEAPPGEKLNTVAIKVQGDSLYQVYQDGDVIFYSRDGGLDEADFIGRECVVKLASGAIMLKRVMRGGQRGRYTLISYNAPPISDIKLEWAGPVRWVRRG